MSERTRVRIVVAFSAVMLVLGLAAGALALNDDPDATIHVDDAPAYACVGTDCP